MHASPPAALRRARRLVRRSAAGLALAAVALLWAACAALGDGAADEPNPYLNTAPGVAYVGSAACADCHEDLYTSYQSHGMARSFYRMTDSVAVEDFSGVVVAHPTDGYLYTVYRDGGRFVQEEYRLGPDGQKTHRLVRAMDWVVGSGSAARTYLSEVGGRLYELPLTWYTQATAATSDGGADGQGADSGGAAGEGGDGSRGRWDFSPGYRAANDRFNRTIPPRCMACHNDVSPPVPFVDGAYTSLAEGIGCERCHGPGALHVEARLADPEAPDSVDYTIVNPRHLTLDRRLDVCQQCHLSAEVSVLRDTADAFGYRPSRPLESHVALFALADSDPHRVSVISHADRMRQSPCFIQSGAMDCTTCHNPHEGFRDAGPSYFNRTCLSCHPAGALQQAMPTPQLRTQHAATAPCFSCHMPKVEADDAPHSSFTDHYIRVVRDDGRITGTAQPDAAGDLQPYFEEDRENADAPAYEGMAYVVYGRQRGDRAALTRGADALARALEETPELGEGQFLLGFARLQMNQPREAIGPLEAAVARGPRIPERLNALAQAYEGAGRPAAEIDPLYRRALEAQPRAAEIRVNYGRFLEAAGRAAEAAQQYARAAQDDPALAQAPYNLGTLLARAGRPDEAEAPLRAAIALDPGNADALLNLGAIIGQRGGTAEATALFRQATLADPRNANAHGNLSMALAQQDDLAAARREAEIALALDPNQPAARQVLAALQAAGL